MNQNAPYAVKLDTYLATAVAGGQSDLLRVMIRIGGQAGAGGRVHGILGEHGLTASQVLQSGRLLVVAVSTADLMDLAASADVERISFDAVVRSSAP